MAEGGEGESVGEKRKVKEGRESFFPFMAHVFFLPNSQTPISLFALLLLVFNIELND